ncbi:MAG: cytochrome d ubiquinol oxidase subunit II [Candidatus Nephthysia bennettiae]|uniref:Cytochrome d ubiquinol oxidase subunit II n=1 Tax=Candidatus Nephthysia bennettiae TaxID=3127016 RepID=A0A934KAI5_9BACT|nr:cytochrome d ubiquinol oxidase subunit II [Candidatus Dormibacteraeota bacterium]PZR95080.1 MAG: cytochrome d ubiquinol oxidase subunit II [Candidatus Dormibacteraeota bacterium]
MALHVIWYLLFIGIIAAYVVLDGFDLGVGIVHPFVPKDDKERRISLNSIGPVWDGNEVWLVVGGGVLFAAFPEVYATLFSGFYPAFMLVLAFLILRAVSIEFRSKRPSGAWRSFWDWVFGLASLLLALLLGVAFGDIARGVPIDAQHNISFQPLDLVHPYALLVGVTAVAMLAQHGAIYLALKTEGDLQRRVRRATSRLLVVFIALVLLTGIATVIFAPHLVTPYRQIWPLVIPLAAVLAIANIARENRRHNETAAFASSCLGIALLLASVGLGQYPAVLTSSLSSAYSLTLSNSMSSQLTLTVMLIIAAIGMPLVLAYTVGVYWLFRGKVNLGERSY